MQQATATPDKSSLEGLWVLLVDDTEGRIPMMARAGNNQTYVLGFKNAHKARNFMELSALENAEPRMVVRSNRGELLRLAQSAGANGVLVDYDPATHDYSRASELF